MKSKIKRIASILGILFILIVMFHAGTMSLQIDEEFAGKEYEVLFNGTTYEGLVNTQGIIRFPWNPFRQSGLAIIEIHRDEDNFAISHYFSPSYGKHIIFPHSSDSATGHVTNFLGIQIREVRQSNVSLHHPNQNKTVQETGTVP
ncbi:MAG: hypothetical protein JJT75_14140 [Opitutales bacterium]|nr:hypothetical protein [Opitutales bacterium]